MCYYLDWETFFKRYINSYILNGRDCFSAFFEKCETDDIVICSNCKEKYVKQQIDMINYCYNCGAKMERI